LRAVGANCRVTTPKIWGRWWQGMLHVPYYLASCATLTGCTVAVTPWPSFLGIFIEMHSILLVALTVGSTIAWFWDEGSLHGGYSSNCYAWLGTCYLHCFLPPNSNHVAVAWSLWQVSLILSLPLPHLAMMHPHLMLICFIASWVMMSGSILTV